MTGIAFGRFDATNGAIRRFPHISERTRHSNRNPRVTTTVYGYGILQQCPEQTHVSLADRRLKCKLRTYGVREE